MLKIFVRRDTQLNLVPNQIQRFEALRNSPV
jgi:putative heme iron utilization protein